jgi:hypothetical protein
MFLEFFKLPVLSYRLSAVPTACSLFFGFTAFRLLLWVRPLKTLCTRFPGVGVVGGVLRDLDRF